MPGYCRELMKLATRSSGWSKIRKERIGIDQGRCRACGKKYDLQVHHIKPFQFAPELELDIKNTITLCGRCHLLLGHLDSWKSYNSEVAHDAFKTRCRVGGRP